MYLFLRLDNLCVQKFYLNNQIYQYHRILLLDDLFLQHKNNVNLKNHPKPFHQYPFLPRHQVVFCIIFCIYCVHCIIKESGYVFYICWMIFSYIYIISVYHYLLALKSISLLYLSSTSLLWIYLVYFIEDEKYLQSYTKIIIKRLYLTISSPSCGAELRLQFSCTSGVLGILLSPNNQLFTNRGVVS